MAVGNESIIAAIDIGSSKVSCIIAHIAPDASITVLGIGNRVCEGVTGGVVTDMALTEQAIRGSVDQAEKMAGRNVSEVFLAFSGGEPKTQIIETDLSIKGETVTDADIKKVIEKAKAEVKPDGDDQVLHTFPAAISVDGAYGVTKPVGMFANKLGVALLAITVPKGPLKNLEACVRRAHLNVVEVVLAPYAAGIATLHEDEARLGAACIDIGSGATGISIFAKGTLVHSEVIPIGGAQITEEVGRRFVTSVDQAERLKTFMGTTIVDAADDKVEIEVTQVGELKGRDKIVRMPRSRLTALVRNELKLLFATIDDRLEASGFTGVTGERVVLTGGVAQTEGVREFAGDILERRVRIGTPEVISGLPQAAQGPAFASAVGILRHIAALPVAERSIKDQIKLEHLQNQTLIGRVWAWIRKNF